MSLSVGIVGAGRRIQKVYGPLLAMLHPEFRMAGITTRSEERGREAAAELEIPYYSDLERLIQPQKPDCLLVSVAHGANDEVGRTAVATGIPCLLETPAGTTPEAIDELIRISQTSGSVVEVAEQYHRRPIERLKQILIESGIFGSIVSAANDFMGHDYHGFNLIRSYIGREVAPVTVVGQRQENTVEPAGGGRPQSETWWRAFVTFENGAVGRFDFSSLSYHTAWRWERQTRFYGTRGMARGDEMTVVDGEGERRVHLPVERRLTNVGGMEVLAALAVRAEGTLYEWENPWRHVYVDDEGIAVAEGLRALARASAGGPLDYGLCEARVDQALTLAMRRSAETRAPVPL